MSPNSVAFLLYDYPRVSETFIAQEIHALEKKGLDIQIVAFRRNKVIHSIHKEIKAKVIYLPYYLGREPLRVLRAWWAVRRKPEYRQVRSLFFRDLIRDFTAARLRRFGQALVMVQELEQRCSHLHAHFLNHPASVARYAARLLGLTWSCSAHSIDIWTSPDWDKREKLADCQWTVTCTAANQEYLNRLAPPGRVEHLYHGIDFSRFPPPPPKATHPDGSRPDDPVTILSVGRTVDKKGFEDLLEALVMLPADVHWKFVHIGTGILQDKIQALSRKLGLEDRVTWMGPQPQEVVLECYRQADLFALACRISNNGDRDGLPNVLIEANSQQLPVVSTTISAIPELVRDGENGLLAPERNPKAFSGALLTLIRDPQLRERMGRAGEDRVRREFGYERWIGMLADKFGMNSGATPAG